MSDINFVELLEREEKVRGLWAHWEIIHDLHAHDCGRDMQKHIWLRDQRTDLVAVGRDLAVTRDRIERGDYL
jgi:hypothetical protein